VSDQFEHDPIARELRASLQRHAREAPRGDLLAERIVNTTERESRSPRGWRTWSMPLIAAAAVAAVVGGIVGVQSLQTSAHGPTPGTHSGSVLQSPANPSATGSSTSNVVAPPTKSASAQPLQDVTILDLTFVSENQGWALAVADCVDASGRCSALFHLKGTTWWSMPNSTPWNVAGVTGGCADPCVTNIRFADPDVGYAFGPDALFMTQDGGRHWKRQAGGAVALETLDGNVIRVTSTGTGCPGPCGVRVETSAIGSSTWTPSDLPEVSGAGLSFGRGQPSNAYLLVTRNPAGGAEDETSTLYRSTDDGAHWTSVGEPCPQTGSEVDSLSVAGGGPDRVSVMCATRTALQHLYVANSTDGGAHFAGRSGLIAPKSAGPLTGDAATTLVVAGETGLLRSDDGGGTWHHVAGVSGAIGFVGFESTDVGRAVSSDGATIWTTRNGGSSWTSFTFG
jgi:photosystem II stability/assembly factor-like uncharacterized protein